MRILVAQLNPVVGDIEGNLDRIEKVLRETCKDRPDLYVFPELYLTGYPPRDLLEFDWFVDETESALRTLTAMSTSCPESGIVLGAPVRNEGRTGKGLYNAAVLIENGRLITKAAKSLLPTYDVFDESRYFNQNPSVAPVPFRGELIGLTVCEDAWNIPEMWPGNRMYAFDPVGSLAGKGATLLINLSASPFTIGKEAVRFRLIADHARRHGIPFLYVNQVGGNDELIFDGRSIFVDGSGNAVRVLRPFEEELTLVDTAERGKAGGYEPQERIASVHGALRLGIGDYMRKCGFTRAVVGLSGGIDSAVTATMAAEAAGPRNVLGIAMPSPYSSKGSVDDSRTLAGNLGIELRVIPIETIFRAYLDTLTPHFEGRKPDITEENIQARIRGNFLMAFSNKFGYLVLSTGNKSELAVGYCTLYGDMSGGLAAISDVPKTMVYELAAYINRERPVIPGEILKKPPSAELKPDQKDQDTLPPYEVLDRILAASIEEGKSMSEIVDAGFDGKTVRWVLDAVRRNEYKRKQAPPGLKVTSKAFGVGRRMPIAARFSS
jgi:NAD+ synthase (glutamine-hydrolysing)